jgi:hypothetical protein
MKTNRSTSMKNYTKGEIIFYSIVALLGIAIVAIQLTRFILQNYG